MSTEEGIKEMASEMDRRAALDRRFAREREAIMNELEDQQKGMGSHNTFNGSSKFVNAMLTLTVTLLTAGICGGVVAYAQLQAIATEQKNQKDLINYIIAGKFK